MGAKVFWIAGSWRGRLGIVPRPRGADWLDDETRAWREAGIELCTRRFAIRILQFVGHHIEEFQLAYRQIVAEHETCVRIGHQPELRDLLATLEMLTHLGRFKVLSPCADDGAAVGGVLELAFVAQLEACGKLSAG